MLLTRSIEVFFVNSLFVVRAIHDADTWLAGINVDGMIGRLFIEADLDLFVVSSICGDFCSIQGVNVGYNTSQLSGPS
jgi:hypothetical protein